MHVSENPTFAFTKIIVFDWTPKKYSVFDEWWKDQELYFLGGDYNIIVPFEKELYFFSGILVFFLEL